MTTTTTTDIPGAALLPPILALNAWTLIIEAWMYKLRLPAIKQYKVPMTPNMTLDTMNSRFPGPVRWKADNYNHLLEQPVQFYAVTLVVAFTYYLQGQGLSGPKGDQGFDATLAWLYVAARVVHSLIQRSTNVIPWRFAAFGASSVVLGVLTGRGIWLVL